MAIMERIVSTVLSLKIIDQKLCQSMKSFIYNKNKIDVSTYIFIVNQAT